MTKTACVDRRHYSESNNQNMYEKLNPTTQKLVKLIKSSYSSCGRIKSQIFTK